MKTYLCIDLKSFYASCECSKRNLDPFEVNLVVADESRGMGAITLAITPKLKNLGVKNRCRLFEIPKHIKYIIAKPKMSLYIKYSSIIYGIYLKYISKDDIHVYSIDEAFLDITNYMSLYNKSSEEIARMIMMDIYKTTKITATCGIGTNLYLAKIALDIISKRNKSNIGYLNEELYIKTLGNHRPLSDFWQIGKGIMSRLNKLNIYTMNDINETKEELLYKEFGVNAVFLIDHAKGFEPCTIKEIKDYKTVSNSISSSQILFKDYKYFDGLVILKEMIDALSLKLAKTNNVVGTIHLSIGYSKDLVKQSSISKKLENSTNSYRTLMKEFEILYLDIVKKDYLIRKISISLGNLHEKKFEQLNLFDDNEKEANLLKTIDDLKNKYGKNKILRAISYTEAGNQINRNKLIGGHNAE